MTQINKDYINLKYPNMNYVKFNKKLSHEHSICIWVNKMMIMIVEENSIIVMFGGDRITVKESVEEILKIIN